MKGRKRNIRLYIVGVGFALLTLVLWGRLVQVQVFARGHYAEIARSQWKVRKEIPPVRGGIFDRNGRPLALSVRSCSVSLQPEEVENAGKVVAVLHRHLGVPRSSVRSKLKSKKSFIWVKRQCTLSDRAREELSSLRGIGLHWEADRVYPFGDIGAKLVGFVGYDSKGMAGVEAAFDDVLAGTPGWEEVQRDGTYHADGYRTYAGKPPQNGRHVVLTIDARLQEVAELELGRAIDKAEAKGGALIVMDCRDGEILTLAELPAAQSRDASERVDSLWTIRSLAHVYEPGSTFKLVTAASLLEMDRVRTFDIFDAENGKARVGSAVISDSHPHQHLTFREGFVYSSNIVMAKASLRLEPKEFYRFIRLFGFGAETGIGLLGESPGHVAPVDEWSERTQITMAFGQEIAVTPLQMINAYAAVANGGELLVPRVVKSIVDENRGIVKETERVRVRRVISKDTAERIRGFCRAVVEEGTGTGANLDMVKIAGKTGTAEKASPRGGYMPGKFVASFVGFAPDEDPKIVCLIMLDEPKWAYRFGGVSAAPVFARMTEAIANSSAYFDDVLESSVLEARTASDETFITPNFLRLDREKAMERARRLDLNVLCHGEGATVVSQEPGPGVAIARDEVVRLYLGSGEPTAAKVPDLRGLPIRQARRLAIEAGLRCEIEGSGIVRKQSPLPGQVSKRGVVKIHCDDRTFERRG